MSYPNEPIEDAATVSPDYVYKSLVIENEKLKRALEIAREKLGFYANHIEWDYDNKDKEGEFCEIAVTDMECLNPRLSIGGKRARQALKEIEEVLNA